MVYYKNTYHLKQDINIAFDYFLNKDYLIKFFDQNSDENTIVVSQFEDHLIKESEQLRIVSEDNDSIVELMIDNVEIRRNEYIKMRLSFGNFEEKEEEEILDEDEEEELKDFLNKFIGSESYYTIWFYPQKNGNLKVVEKSEVRDVKFYQKVIWKIIGITQKFKQRKMYREVKKEIERLK